MSEKWYGMIKTKRKYIKGKSTISNQSIGNDTQLILSFKKYTESLPNFWPLYNQKLKI